jgi:hypothetical protein
MGNKCKYGHLFRVSRAMKADESLSVVSYHDICGHKAGFEMDRLTLVGIEIALVESSGANMKACRSSRPNVRIRFECLDGGDEWPD